MKPLPSKLENSPSDGSKVSPKSAQRVSPTDAKSNSRNGPIQLIVGLLIVWSLLMAFGLEGYQTIWRYITGAPAPPATEPFDTRQPVIMLGTMGAFLAIWLIALMSKPRDRGKPRNESKP